MAVPGGFALQRDVILNLTPDHPVPPAVPLQLQDHIPVSIWSLRTIAITETAYKYSKPVLEKLWSVIGIMSIVVVPSIIYHFVLRPKIVRPDKDLRDTLMSIDQARAAAFGILVAVALIFVLPFLVWKWIGRREMSSMIKAWETGDMILKGQNVPRPTWKVTAPRLFQNNVTVTITPPQTVSTFHPNSYLPSYINPAPDSSAAYFYPYQKGEPGLPHMSVIGSVPLYMDEKENVMRPMFTSLKGSNV